LPPAKKSPVSQTLQKSIDACNAAKRALPQITTIAETIARRHEAGGLIGFPFESQSLPVELWGRAGGIMHVGFTQPWKKDRSESERANDIAIVGYDHPPGTGDAAALQKLKDRGCYIVGIGPRTIASID